MTFMERQPVAPFAIPQPAPPVVTTPQMPLPMYQPPPSWTVIPNGAGGANIYQH